MRDEKKPSAAAGLLSISLLPLFYRMGHNYYATGWEDFSPLVSVG
jgi:hypothetical protein